MKKSIKLSLFTALAAVFLIAGCKKEDDDNNNVIPQVKLKTLTSLPAGTIQTFYYDANGKISKLTTSGQASYLSYEYKGSDSIIVYSSNGTDSSRVSTYKLNGVGLATVNSTSASTTGYTYDVNGNMIRSTSSSIIGSAADTFDIAGGNIMQHRYGGSNVLLSSTYNQNQQYTYNTNTNTVGNTNRGMSFLGKASTNLVVSETFSSKNVTLIPPPTIVNETYVYTYEYDSNNRVTKMTKTAVTAGTVTSETYTYY